MIIWVLPMGTFNDDLDAQLATQTWDLPQDHRVTKFAGTPRYEVLREIARGGMGAVYEVVDHQRSLRVALKTLARRDSRWLLRFKREYRLVADLHHPNLPRLYDLSTDGDEWFFTMELVEGCDFFEFVRGYVQDSDTSGSSSGVSSGSGTNGIDPHRGPDPDPVSPSGVTSKRQPIWHSATENRLRHVLPQLAGALHAIHETGIVHLDIKPANVLVTPAGHLFLLDFGVSKLIEESTAKQGVLGTPVFMAPEQARGEPLGPAADWYAVGTILFMALTGIQPYPGPARAVLQAKREGIEPRSVAELCPDAPSDLASLADSLLALHSDERPSSSEILARLKGSKVPVFRHSPTGYEVFVGRKAPLGQLRALAESLGFHPGWASITGPSGIGKTTLIRRFLAEQPTARVLWGRCHERENVPFRAFDAAIDALIDELQNLPADTLEPLLPDESSLLAQLFPGFGVLATSPRHASQSGRTPAEVRRDAFSLLRELFSRVALLQPLIIVLDDLQWADPESLELLDALVDTSTTTPKALFLATMRDEIADEVSSRIDRALGRLPDERVQVIALSPLSTRSQKALIERLGGEIPQTIWKSAEGNPLMLTELVRTVDAAWQGEGPSTFAEILTARVDRLAPISRRLLQVTAVAARPTALSALAQAVDLPAATREECLASLRSARLLRTVRPDADPAVDVIHDQIRTCVVSRMHPEDLATIHLALARALAAKPNTPKEIVAQHLLAADQGQEAAEAFTQAGFESAKRLAFDAAAGFFEEALRHGTWERERVTELQIARADALVNAGRSSDAARVYSDAAGQATDPKKEAWLARRYAEELLRAGEHEAGQEAMRAVLAKEGIRLPKTNLGAISSFIKNRLILAARKYRPAPDRDAPLDEATLERLELLATSSQTLIATNQLFGAAVILQYLRHVLNRSDDEHYALASASTLILLVCEGQFTSRVCLELMQRMQQVAERPDLPRARAHANLSLGIASYIKGDWDPAIERLKRAATLLATTPDGGFEHHHAVLFRNVALTATGEIEQVTKNTASLLRRVERTGNPYEQVSYALLAAIQYMARDEPEEHEIYCERLQHALARTPAIPELLFVLGRMIALSYRGSHEEAVSIALEWIPRFKRALVMANPNARCWMAELLAHAAMGARDLRAAQLARRMVEPVGNKIPFAKASAQYARAIEAGLHGRRDDYIQHLRAAVDGYREFRFGLWLYPACYRLGTTLGGDEGAVLLDEARSWAHRQALTNPERWLSALG